MQQQRSILIVNADTPQGDATVRQLLSEDNRNKLAQHYSSVIGTVHDIARSGDLLTLGCELWQMKESPEERQFVEQLKHCRVEAVILNPDCGSEQMSKQAISVINACKQAGVKCLAFISHIGVDKDKKGEVAKMFRDVERCIDESGIEHTAILRCSIWIQTLFLFRRMMQAGNISLPIKEDRKFTMVSIHDIACFLVCELLQRESFQRKAGFSSGGKTHEFNLTGPKTHTAKEISELLSNTLGTRLQYKQIQRNEFEQYLVKEVRMPKFIAKGLGDVFDMIEQGLLDKVSDDQKKSTGKEPVKIEEWVNRHKQLLLAKKQ